MLGNLQHKFTITNINKNFIDTIYKIYTAITSNINAGYIDYYIEKKENNKLLYIYCICSKAFGKKIAEKGITPHKSLTLNVSEDILTNTFIRGVFEGDGHIRNTLTSKGYKRFEAGFVTGSERFALQIEKFLIKNDIKCYLYQEDKNTYRIRVSGKENLKKFYHVLYNKCDKWFLFRKKQILDLLFSNE